MAAGTTRKFEKCVGPNKSHSTSLQPQTPTPLSANGSKLFTLTYSNQKSKLCKASARHLQRFIKTCAKIHQDICKDSSGLVQRFIVTSAKIHRDICVRLHCWGTMSCYPPQCDTLGGGDSVQRLVILSAENT